MLPPQPVRIIVIAASALALLADVSGCAERNAGRGRTDIKKDVAMNTQKAMFGMGCFWGAEAVFMQTPGVTDTAVGFSGGELAAPSYKQVCTDTTGHAEVVLVEFDPDRVSYEQLLDVFWKSHNPTTLNRQGPDVGVQYRSVIFTYGEEQTVAADSSRKQLEASGRFDKPIVTEIKPAGDFHRAEEYHQKYLQKHGKAACPTQPGK